MKKEKKFQMVAATAVIAFLKQRTGDLSVFSDLSTACGLISKDGASAGNKEGINGDGCGNYRIKCLFEPVDIYL